MISRDKKILDVLSREGIANGKAVLAASRKTGVPLSVCCALLRMESNGRNIFGSDSGQPNALPDSWKEGKVTRLRYLYFIRRVKKGLVSNGVGPAQLTSQFLLEAADKIGGAWKVTPNMEIGFDYIKSLSGNPTDWEAGFSKYNGSSAYGARAIAIQKQFHEIFQREGLTK